MSILNRDLVFLPDYAAILSFPLADYLLRSLPVTEALGTHASLSRRVLRQPKWGTGSVGISAPSRVACNSFGDAIDGQHCGTLLTDTGLR